MIWTVAVVITVALLIREANEWTKKAMFQWLDYDWHGHARTARAEGASTHRRASPIRRIAAAAAVAQQYDIEQWPTSRITQLPCLQNTFSATRRSEIRLVVTPSYRPNVWRFFGLMSHYQTMSPTWRLAKYTGKLSLSPAPLTAAAAAEVWRWSRWHWWRHWWR